jgi:hypothetical protein
MGFGQEIKKSRWGSGKKKRSPDGVRARKKEVPMGFGQEKKKVPMGFGQGKNKKSLVKFLTKILYI